MDACFIGPNDLAWSMGLGEGPGAKDPAHVEAVNKVLAGAKKVGVSAGMHCRSVEEVWQRAEQGFQFLACLSDVYFLSGVVNQGVKQIREKIGRPKVGE